MADVEFRAAQTNTESAAAHINIVRATRPAKLELRHNPDNWFGRRYRAGLPVRGRNVALLIQYSETILSIVYAQEFLTSIAEVKYNAMRCGTARPGRKASRHSITTDVRA